MKVGVVGLGYVGLPLALAFAEEGRDVVGGESDPRKAGALSRGESYIEDVPSARLAAVRDRLRAVTAYERLRPCDAVMIAVPTPLPATASPSSAR
jgi:UDP-N-acetyl-D-glucosamine dehydrogenase